MRIDSQGVHYDIAESVPLVQCADGSFCCCSNLNGTCSDDCCSWRAGQFLVNGELNTTKPSTVLPLSDDSTKIDQSTSITAVLTTQSVGSELPLSTSSPRPTYSSIGTIVGSVLGGVSAIAILTLTFWYFKLRRRSSHSAQLQPKTQDQIRKLSSVDDRYVFHKNSSEVSEIECRGEELKVAPRQELDAAITNELHGNNL